MSYKDLEKKIIKLDPLAEGLSNVGFEGGAGKLTTKKNFKNFKRSWTQIKSQR
jgi:hypothetical protein